MRMIRAGVFIGVDQSGGLQPLRDAAAGAASMHAWALAQGMDEVAARLITDAGGQRVTPDAIYDAIGAIVGGPGVDQLIVYFAGHGVNINRSEHWLLSDAPVRTSAAVSVAGSVELARYCGIQHVVLISDACRVAPEGIQAQNVRGIDIFPNEGVGDRAKPVDQFFACLLGRTAAEIKNPGEAATNYTALYTETLLDALKGHRPDLLDPSATEGDSARYIKARRLQRYLETEVPARVRARALQKKVNQDPDAIITSDGEWLSRIDVVPPTPPPTVSGDPGTGEHHHPGRGRPPLGGPPPHRGVEGAQAPSTTFRAAVQDLTHSAVNGGPTDLRQTIERLRAGAGPVGDDFATTLETVAAPFGPKAFESECGIKVRGARILDVFAPRARFTLQGDRDIVRVDLLEDHTAASVLVQLDGGSGTVVPAIPGFIAGLTFADGDLIDVAYEPSANSWRWGLYQSRAPELRALRAVAASSSQHGRFQLDREDAITVAQRLQFGKGVDPALAVYAAYAYHDLQEVGRIRHMSDYLTGDIGVSLLDLELLGRRLIGRSANPYFRLVPFTPLLAQGWALLRAHRFQLHPLLDALDHELLDSVWSLYSADGVNRLRAALATRDVR